jgi:hypothetical protein
MLTSVSKLIVESKKEHDGRHLDLAKRTENALERSLLWLEKHNPNPSKNSFIRAFSSN